MNLTRRDLLAAAVAGVPIAGTASAQTPKPPNILFLFPDQLRPDWLETTPGIPVRTPIIAALAKRGVLFERAWCASPLCAPSRACLAAGMEYDRCRVPGNGADFPLDQPTFYQSLTAAGYHVSGCGKFDLHKATEYWGEDGKRLLPEWGFADGVDNAGKFDAVRSGIQHPRDPYMGYLHQEGLVQVHATDLAARTGPNAFTNTDPTPLPDHAYCDNWIGQNGLNLLRAVPQGRPWFLQVNFTGPHDPLDVTESMYPLYDKEAGFPQPNRNTQYSAAKHLQMRRNYSAMVENIDRWCGKLIEEVERRGELENTLILFSSDHGEMLGDHNRWQKRVPYEASTGVPLVVAGPGVREGLTTAAPASVMDVAATCLDFAGLPVPKAMDSRSLRPLLTGASDSHRDYLFSGLEPWRGVTDGRYKLVRGFDPAVPKYYPSRNGPLYTETRDQPPLLFDLAEDPQENRNIAGQAPDVLRRLDEALAG